jgi:hypothetical protein
VHEPAGPPPPRRRHRCVRQLALPPPDRLGRRLRGGRLPRRPAQPRGPGRLVRAPRRAVVQGGRPPGDAVVLEHRGGLGHRAPGAARARLGVPAGRDLGQGPGPHRRQRQRQDAAPLPRGHRGVRDLLAGAVLPHRGGPDVGPGLAALRVAAGGPVAAAGQRGLRGEERGHPQVPHPGLAVVLPAAGDDGAAGRLRQPSRGQGGPSLLLPGRAASGDTAAVGRPALPLEPPSRADQRLEPPAAVGQGAAARRRPALGPPDPPARRAGHGAPQPEAADVHGADRGGLHRAGRCGLGALRGPVHGRRGRVPPGP